MIHYVLLETNSTWEKETATEAIKNKHAIYSLDTLAEKVGHFEDVVKSLMLDVAHLPIKTGDDVFVVCGDKTGIEEHIVVAALQKRFCETIELIVIRENNVIFEVPWESRCFLEDFNRDSTYANTNFSSESGGCGSGGCGGCTSC